MAGKPRVASPDVIAFAEKTKLDLTQVAGSGVDGTVTRSDAVRAHWDRMRPAIAEQIGLDRDAGWPEVAAGMQVLAALKERREEAARANAADAAERERMMPTAVAASSAEFARRVANRGAAFALNPLVDAVRAHASAAAPAPSAGPTLFASGDVPSFTASGVPPEALLEVPWQARHAMAAASTAAEAYAIQTECSGRDGQAIAESLYGGHDGNVDYQGRVQQWQVASMTDDELYASVIPGANDELSRRAAEPLSPEDVAGVDAEVDAYLHYHRLA